jgi:hypothetical protein
MPAASTEAHKSCPDDISLDEGVMDGSIGGVIDALKEGVLTLFHNLGYPLVLVGWREEEPE